MCENRMCTYMCNWVTVLYSRKKKYWGNNKKKVMPFYIMHFDIPY